MGQKSLYCKSRPRKLRSRAVNGYEEKLLSRRRHQEGQLIELTHGWAMRHYADTDGERNRVQEMARQLR